MKAAIYVRYSSENQRPESIADQILACRRFAAERGFEIDEALIFCLRSRSHPGREGVDLS